MIPTNMSPHRTARTSLLKKGGNPEAVDYRGLLNTAQACIDLGIPRLVVVSRSVAVVARITRLWTISRAG